MTVGSLFSGVGGFDMGLEAAGMRVLWQVEYDEQAQAVLRHRWPDAALHKDVCDVVGIPLDEFPLSRRALGEQGAGAEGRDRAGDRIECRGSVATNGGDGDGCRTNAGGTSGRVPAAGHRHGRPGGGGEYDPASDNGDGHARTNQLVPVDLICGGFPCQDLSVAGRRSGLVGERSGLFYEFMRIVDELAPRWVLIENVPGLLSSNGGRDMGAVLGTLAELGYGYTYRVLDTQYFGPPQRRKRVFIVGCAGGFCPPEVLLEPEGLPWNPAPSREARKGVAGSAAGGAGEGGVAKALRAQAQDPHREDAMVDFTMVTHAPRRLTPRECERLQGWPDDWTRWGRTPDGELIALADSPRYRMCGNGVSAPVAAWIAKRIMEAA